MSKAFTRESDDEQESRVSSRRPRLPLGVKNYITPDGFAARKGELARLQETERPRILAQQSEISSPSGAASPELKALDQQIREYLDILETAEVVGPPAEGAAVLRFGGIAEVQASPLGEVSTYRIVGMDEVDIDKGWISWLSPLAKVLIGKRVGDEVRFRFPAGEQVLKVLSIRYL